MNLNVMKDEVRRLLFVDELDGDEAFLYAVNRAIFRTRSVFPKTKRVKIANLPLKNIISAVPEKRYFIKGEKVFFGNDLKSYFFEAEGIGKASFFYYNSDPSVGDYELLFSVEINSPVAFKKHRGFVKRFGAFADGAFKVVFSGDYVFSVKNLALYDSLLSPDEEDVPDFAKTVEIDLEKATTCLTKELGASRQKSDFLSLAKPVRLFADGEREEIAYTLVDRTLCVSRDNVGEIEVEYFALPETCGVSSNESDELDFPVEVAGFAAYLVASSLLLEDDAELASYYLSRYLEAEEHAKSLVSIKSGIYEFTSKEIF